MSPGHASGMQMVEPTHETLSGADFERVVRLVQGTAGIHLPEHKRSMVEQRLARRARALGLSGPSDYCAYVFDGPAPDDEMTQLIGAITTNKTDFFRESEHFDLLTQKVLPDLKLRFPGIGASRPLRLWSAGCSTGEEAYSAAMVLAEYAARHPRFEFTIHATDICAHVVETGVRAVYAEERVCGVPMDMRRAYLLRNKDRTRALVRIAPELRSRVRFGTHNLLVPGSPSPDPLDVIFCRNVIIYFQREIQVRVLQNLCQTLRVGGYLFVGHSETLHGMALPLEHVGPTLYRKR